MHVHPETIAVCVDRFCGKKKKNKVQINGIDNDQQLIYLVVYNNYNFDSKFLSSESISINI